ncbi:hypothetical protein ACL655_04980 [Klebsiella quasipneumoniae subsp. similipneumoniae]
MLRQTDVSLNTQRKMLSWTFCVLSSAYLLFCCVWRLAVLFISLLCWVSAAPVHRTDPLGGAGLGDLAGNQLARLERGQPLSENHICLIITDCCGGSGSYYTWHWYQNKPKPVDVAPLVVQDISASVQRPSAVNYNRDDNSAQIVVVTFSRSAAPVTLIGKPVTAGITLTPQWKVSGSGVMTVSWYSRRKNLPDGKTYTVDMDAKTLLAPQVALTEKQNLYHPEFYYRGGRAEFYQDPQDPMKNTPLSA